MNKHNTSEYARYDMTEIKIPKKIHNKYKFIDLITDFNNKYTLDIDIDNVGLDDCSKLIFYLIVELQEQNQAKLNALESRMRSLEKNKNKVSSCCVIF